MRCGSDALLELGMGMVCDCDHVPAQQYIHPGIGLATPEMVRHHFDESRVFMF